MANKITVKTSHKEFVISGKNLFVIKFVFLKLTFYEWKSWLPNKRLEYYFDPLEYIVHITYE